MTDHSAGPWRACRTGNCPCGFIWADDGQVQVASVHGPSALGQDWYGSDTVCNEETQKANARLIVAAPDLLHELRTSCCPAGGWNGMPADMEPTVDNCIKHGSCACTAGNAVRKATAQTAGERS